MFEILWILVVCFKIKLDWGKLKKIWVDIVMKSVVLKSDFINC